MATTRLIAIRGSAWAGVIRSLTERTWTRQNPEKN